MLHGTMLSVKVLMLAGESVKPLQFYCSCLPASLSCVSTYNYFLVENVA